MQREEDVSKKVGSLIAARRSALGLSQRAFAESLAGQGMTVDASAVSRIESGARVLRVTELLAIATLLDVRLGDLVPQSPSEDPLRHQKIGLLSARANLLEGLRSFLDARVELAISASMLGLTDDADVAPLLADDLEAMVEHARAEQTNLGDSDGES
ncbi:MULTISPECIES: helix-turn-helix domain-containing protein [unclassified Frondihabitans]|uniref:helix-turn-helix domain-containing protein n=1 Tax=unclassified Frondihabitans TaxID=2626248 RepID=UPI000FBAF31B|nr:MULTISPECIES: helix-turn-helix transcriptional regulator [unclassified Frondihabitans]RPE75213.1 helix-turn-helix protein [Frondihabitans sp. PhB153]RPF04455.1 helix-turn-helix protein [Frondihabitans sp. PhB161]